MLQNMVHGRHGLLTGHLEIVGVLVCPHQEHGDREVPGAHKDSIHLMSVHVDVLRHHRAIGKGRSELVMNKALGPIKCSTTITTKASSWR